MDQTNKKKSTSSHDIKGLEVGSEPKSVSDENIFKTFLPFLDEKKKTLSGSSNKTLPAVSLF